MKAKITLIVCILITNTLFSQVIELSEGISLVPITIKDNIIYYGNRNEGKILVYDISTDTGSEFFSSDELGFPFSFRFYGDFLYIADNSEIHRIDISASPLILETVVSGLNAAQRLAIKDDELYYSEYFGDKISKIDLTASSPTPVEVVSTNLTQPGALAFINNNLYFDNNNGLYKIDVTETNPVPTEISSDLSPTDLFSNGTDLYINQGNNIVKFDTTAENIEFTDVVSIMNSAKQIHYHSNDYIYMTQWTKLSYFDATNLSTLEFDQKFAPKLFPNPSSDFIQLSGLTTKERYTIYNILGAEIKKGSISKDETINIKGFTNGFYFLKFDNGNTIKFIKE